MEIKSIKDILNKSSKVFSLRIVSIISGFYLMYLITNIYGSEGMGVFALSQTILMIMVLLSVFGTDTASLKYSSEYFSNKDYNKLNSFYLSIIKLVLILSIFISFFSCLLAQWSSASVHPHVLGRQAAPAAGGCSCQQEQPSFQRFQGLRGAFRLFQAPHAVIHISCYRWR